LVVTSGFEKITLKTVYDRRILSNILFFKVKRKGK